jgi:hypothetical protein
MSSKKAAPKEILLKGIYLTIKVSALFASVVSNSPNKIFQNRMAIFPRWSGLKHFYNVTTTQFTDGQAFYDILKVCTDFWTS